MHQKMKNNKLNILNVGTGKDISIKELAFKISNLLNYKGQIIWDKRNLMELQKNY